MVDTNDMPSTPVELKTANFKEIIAIAKWEVTHKVFLRN